MSRDINLVKHNLFLKNVVNMFSFRHKKLEIDCDREFTKNVTFFLRQ